MTTRTAAGRDAPTKELHALAGGWTPPAPPSRRREQPGPARTDRPRFRVDIEGLRAVAVMAVVLYHAHVGFLGGGYVGVDVFFVISGFLITDLLWREVGGSGRLSFARFYGRRMRRLLPASMVVLAATMLASARWLPPLQVHTVWKDGVASALYVGNYRFALQHTSYLASSAPPSPFQHYWSLGVEEQFYLIWPALILLAARAWAKRPRSRRAPLLALSLVAVSSFVASLMLTHANEPWAFFSLPTRAWELAAGGLIALTAPWFKTLPSKAAAAIGWLGLAAIGWSVVAFSSSTAFPGTAALVPVLGTGAVIAAGLVRLEHGPIVVLRRTTMRFLGRISYSLYLWHWPVLILTPYLVGHALGLADNLGLVVVSVVLATGTYLLVERPGRDWRWLKGPPHRSLSVGASLTACGVAACALAAASLPSTGGHGLAPVVSLHAPSSPGRAPTPNPLDTQLDSEQSQVEAAVAQSANSSNVPANLDPPLARASASESAPDVDGCLVSYTATSSRTCLFGDTTASRSMVLFGDSHAAMWFPAIDSYASAQHLRLYVLAKAACPPVLLPMFSPDLGREFSECDQWRTNSISRIQALKPALVVLAIAPNYDSAYHITQDGSQWLRGLTATISDVRQAGARVAVMGPIPSPNGPVPDCLSAHLSSVQTCAIPVQKILVGGVGLQGIDLAGEAAERTAVEQAGASFVDVQPWFCTATSCPVIVNNLLVFRDNSHITVPYATYLAPLVSDELQLAAGIR